MKNIQEQIAEIENELLACPVGYISRKIISGKERLYLQWMEDGKLKSRYIKNDERDEICASVERRKQLQNKLKELKNTPDGIVETSIKRKVVRNMQNITGYLMLEDTIVAKIKNGIITTIDESLSPLYLKRTQDIEGWLASRAIDEHRTNSRLLKKVLRLHAQDNAQTSLAVNAATITDRYWFKPEGSKAVYEDIRFKFNYFDTLALRGNPDSFSFKPSRTPELTNTGSFEKCWKLIDGKWWMLKSGNDNEHFSELFICKLGEKLGLNMAHYEYDGKYIRTLDFTNGAEVNFEPMRSLVDNNDDYEDCFNVLNAISSKIAEQYLLLIWMDTVCYNMDRHTENFGLLRDIKTGKILSLAPNYDNNIALIARGYPSDVERKNDGIIRFFHDFILKCDEARKMISQMELPNITQKIINECLDEISFDVDRDFISSFILNGQKIIHEIIDKGDVVTKDDSSFELML